MLSPDLGLFISVTLIVSASPGPVMLACMSNGARFGVAKATTGMVGASLGNLVLVLLSALGLGLLVSHNTWLFNGIKWLGAAYLIIWGIQILRQPMLQPLQPEVPEDQSALSNPSNLSSQSPLSKRNTIWLSSFIIAVCNPKGLIYFGALFPQFIDYQKPLASQYGLLTLIFLISDLVWMYAYAIAGYKIMHWLKKPKHQILFNRISGAILAGVGIAMAFSGNHE
jgi:homoserine/homoserine lactone efflux protein